MKTDLLGMKTLPRRKVDHNGRRLKFITDRLGHSSIKVQNECRTHRYGIEPYYQINFGLNEYCCIDKKSGAILAYRSIAFSYYNWKGTKPINSVTTYVIDGKLEELFGADIPRYI